MEPIEYNGMPNSYTYMGWQLITATETAQWKLGHDSGWNFDDEGFGVIDGCYVIATTSHYGQVGDFVNFTLASGEILPCILGEVKSAFDANWTEWGHVADGTLNVIEFCVDLNTWYNPMHANPGTPSCHPEWAGQLQGYDKVGNFWSGGRLGIMANLCTVTAKRYVEGAIKEVEYVGTVQTDGYIYFNDDTFWRLGYSGQLADTSNLQMFYIPKQIWVRTQALTDIQVKALSANGGTALPPGGQGVEAAVVWACGIASDDSHGYDQPNRDGGVDFDCSSLVSWSFRENGFDIPMPSPSTYTMVDAFTNAGALWLQGLGNDSSELYRGDILLFIGDPNAGTGHTAIYIGDGQVVEACINEFGDIGGGQPGDQTGSEIRIGGFYPDSWDGVLRFGTSSGGGNF